MEKRRPSIATMVNRAVKSGMLPGNDALLSYSPLHKGRRGPSNNALEKRFYKMMMDRQAGEDSGYEEPMVGDTSAYSKDHPECENYDQQVFNIIGKKTIPNQKRPVVTTTAIVVRDCPEKADDIREYSLRVKPVLSKAIIRPKVPVVYDFAEREKEMNRLLLEAAAEIRTYPRIFDEDTLVEMWLDKRDAIKASKKKQKKY